MGAYGDKLAELRATAEGGAAGRTAYREGRQRLISDQRAAIDAALAGPVQYTKDTERALHDIVAPVGSTAAGRMDFASERYGESMGALDGALGQALSQQAGARKLNYDTTFGDARLATDRSIEMAEISRRQAEEAAAARAASSAAAAYTAAEQEKIAEFLGGAAHDEDLAALQAQQRQQASNDLLALAREAFSTLPAWRQAPLIMQVRANADDPDAIAALIAKYSPAHRRQAEGLFGRVGSALQNTAAAVLNSASAKAGAPLAVPPAPRAVADPARAQAISRLLDSYTALPPRQEQEYRDLELERYLYDRDAYASMWGDPLLAAALYPQSFEPVAEARDVRETFDQYRDTGLTGSQYDRYMEDQERSAEAAWKFDVATGAATSPAIVERTAKSFGLDEINLYANLEPGADGHKVLTGTLTAAAAALDGGTDLKDVTTAAVKAVRTDAQVAGLDKAYADALARIVAEQLKVYAKG